MLCLLYRKRKGNKGNKHLYVCIYIINMYIFIYNLYIFIYIKQSYIICDIWRSKDSDQRIVY